MKKIISTFRSIISKFVCKNKQYLFEFDNMATSQNMSALFKDDFKLAYAKAVDAVGSDYCIPLRIHQAIWCASNTCRLKGDFVELGCGKGFIFSAILSYLSADEIDLKNRSIFLFDSFIPYKPDSISGRQESINSMAIKARAYADGPQQTIDNFRGYANVNVIEGTLPASLSNVIDAISDIAFLHVDLNHHIPEIECLDLLWPKLCNNSLILLDDYANIGRAPQWEAHERFFSAKNHLILTTASGQGLVIVNKS